MLRWFMKDNVKHLLSDVFPKESIFFANDLHYLIFDRVQNTPLYLLIESLKEGSTIYPLYIFALRKLFQKKQKVNDQTIFI